MSAQRFVSVHGADGLDHLGTSKAHLGGGTDPFGDAAALSDANWEANVAFTDTRDEASGEKRDPALVTAASCNRGGKGLIR